MEREVAIVGGGPVGMAVALLLAHHDVSTVLLDRAPELVTHGSKAINFATHSLRLFEHLGVLDEVLTQSVSLRSARTYYRDVELFSTQYEPPAAGLLPAFVNVSQVAVEQALRARVLAEPRIDLRLGTLLLDFDQDGDGVDLLVEGPDGTHSLHASYLVGCDGSRSTVRAGIGVGFPGRSFADRFIIADMRAQLPFPQERRFFFDPAFNRGRQVLVHPQHDGVWRIDWQVPGAVDAEDERRSGALDRRIKAMFGSIAYELVWVSTYQFHQRLATRFRDRRVMLAGDACHLMSPFGGRGLNSGLEDAADLGWRLGSLLKGRSGADTLDAYEGERRGAALENLRVTGETMQFMVPSGRRRRLRRDALLRASASLPALRRWVDSGRLSVPANYAAVSGDGGRPVVGQYAPDAPLEVAGVSTGVQALRHQRGTRLMVVGAGLGLPPVPADGAPTYVLGPPGARLDGAAVQVADPSGRLRAAYGAPGATTSYAMRPDGHIASATTSGAIA